MHISLGRQQILVTVTSSHLDLVVEEQPEEVRVLYFMMTTASSNIVVEFDLGTRSLTEVP